MFHDNSNVISFGESERVKYVIIDGNVNTKIFVDTLCCDYSFKVDGDCR